MRTQTDPETDSELIAAVLAGDVDRYAVLVGRYRDRFTRFAVRMLGSREDADEVMQDAFLRAFRALDRCDRERFGGWLYQIVINLCRTRATRGARRERRLVRDEETLASLPAVQPPEEDSALRAEIERALARLDVQQREAFLLKHVEELSYEEMAEITGVGVSALKMRVKRACERLRAMLEEVQHA